MGTIPDKACRRTAKARQEAGTGQTCRVMRSRAPAFY